MTVNKVVLIGNLGADPETRTTASGTAVSNLRLATTDRQKDKDGNWVDHTEWHRVVCFGRTAENVSKYLQKGRQLYVEGRIRTQKWQDREGKDRWTTEIIAEQVRFLGSRGDSAGGQTAPPSSGGGPVNEAPPTDSSNAPSSGGGMDDDIPF